MQIKVIVDRKTFKEISREVINSNDEVDYEPLVRVLAEDYLKDIKKEALACQK